jgi:hypothetical protein
LKTAKECVTTHLPNGLAPKMDGASAGDRYITIVSNAMRQCVGGRERRDEGFEVILSETAFSADLGGSSKYSNENFEDRSGEGFLANSVWTRVSRS